VVITDEGQPDTSVLPEPDPSAPQQAVGRPLAHNLLFGGKTTPPGVTVSLNWGTSMTCYPGSCWPIPGLWRTIRSMPWPRRAPRPRRVGLDRSSGSVRHRLSGDDRGLLIAARSRSGQRPATTDRPGRAVVRPRCVGAGARWAGAVVRCGDRAIPEWWSCLRSIALSSRSWTEVVRL